MARTAWAACRNYGTVLADFLVVGALDQRQLLARMTIAGRAHVDEALAGGRGCIMAVPHMGSWDMGGSLAGALGYRVAAVAERMPGSLEDAVVGTRQALGLRVIPLGRAAVRAILAELEQNGIVALLCDLPHGPGVRVEMLGREVTLPSGPGALACRAGAPLLPAFVVGTERGHYRIEIDHPIPVEGRCHGRDAARGLMQDVARCFERYIRAHPDQWFAFQALR